MSHPDNLIGVLEPRLLFSHTPTSVDFEQYMIELINRARANPAAEATRQGIALNEGLPAGTISTAAKQPLAPSPFLAVAARGHTQWMIDHQLFQHEGPNNNSPQQRMSDAGYSFTPTYFSAENIAWQGTIGAPNVTTVTAQLHSNLFTDDGIAGRGHRTNLMNPDLREIGVGVIVGNYQGYQGVWTTNDFAASAAYPGPFLTGVAYADTVTADHFYTPGEGIGSLTVTATRQSDGQTFTTTTAASGGYAMQLPAGTYTVTAAGTGLSAPITAAGVTVTTENVKQDFVAGGSTTGGGTAALSVDFTSTLPASLKPGDKTTVNLRFHNTGIAAYSGTVHPAIYFSKDTTIDSGDLRVGNTTTVLSLAPGQSKTVTFNVTSPVTLADGSYHLLAADASTPIAGTSSTVHIIAPTVNLVPSFAGAIKKTKRGKPAAFSLQIKNVAGYAAAGTVTVSLSLKRAGGKAVSLPRLTGIAINVKANGTTTLKRSVTLPANLAPGNYSLVATLTAALSLKETPTKDDTATSAAFAVTT